MVLLTGSRHGVEGPGEFACSQIPRADVARWSAARRLLRMIPGDGEVLIDRRWRRQRDTQVWKFVADPFSKVDLAAVAEVADVVARLRVQCDQQRRIVRRPEDHARSEPWH